MAQGDVVAKLIGTRWQSFALQSKGANPLKFSFKNGGCDDFNMVRQLP